MQLCSTKKFQQRGDCYGLASKNTDGIPYLLSLLGWIVTEDSLLQLHNLTQQKYTIVHAPR